MFSVFLAKPAWAEPGDFTDSGQALGNSESVGLELGDVDGDGDLDAFVANFNAQPNRVWFFLSGDAKEIIIDFGSQFGLWIWMNNTTWVQLHSVSPEGMVTGNIDGN